MTRADHMICGIELSEARKEAKRLGVKLPKGMTAIRAGLSRSGGEGWFLVESRDGFRKEVWAFSASQAKAKAIEAIVNAAVDQREMDAEGREQ